MLRKGMAMHYHMDFDNCEIYDKFEEAAKRHRQGLWAQDNIETPWDYRHNLAKRRHSNVHKDIFQA